MIFHVRCGPGRNHNPEGNSIHKILMFALQMLNQWDHRSRLEGEFCSGGAARLLVWGPLALTFTMPVPSVALSFSIPGE